MFTLKDLFSVVLILGVAGFSGHLTGKLTGASGPDAGVVAAITPVLISGVGTIVIVAVGKGENKLGRLIFSTAFVLCFFLFFEASMDTTAGQRQIRARENAIDVFNRRIKMVEICSAQQARLNDGRGMLGLPPLEFETVCPRLR